MPSYVVEKRSGNGNTGKRHNFTNLDDVLWFDFSKHFLANLFLLDFSEAFAWLVLKLTVQLKMGCEGSRQVGGGDAKGGKAAAKRGSMNPQQKVQYKLPMTPIEVERVQESWNTIRDKMKDVGVKMFVKWVIILVNLLFHY